MRRYRHVLLTRFNAPLQNINSSRRLDDDWLRPRLDLFEQWCLPSVRAQKADFEWALFIDAETPEWARTRLAASGAHVIPVKPRWRAQDELVAAGLVDRKWLITTRLDNDDAIASDYLGQVQRRFDRQRRALIRFPRGVQVRDGTVYSWTYVRNPFYSYVERVWDHPPRTAQGFKHHTLPAHLPSVDVWTRPSWLQVIHGDNVRNRVQGVLRVRGMAGLRFPLEVGPPRDPWPLRLQTSWRGIGWAIQKEGYQNLPRTVAGWW